VQTPLIWVLLDDRPGHQTQAKGLASELGQPFQTKMLAFNAVNKLPNSLIGATIWSLDRQKSDLLAPPWPDIVIAMGRRCLPVARWIRRSSGCRSKLIHVGRKGVTAADEFSLLISCAHFNMPPHRNRLAVTLPPTQVTETSLAEARREWPDLMTERSQPRLVLLAGGETTLHDFPASFARDLVLRAEAAARALGGSLTVVTSRRTSAEAVQAMQQAVDETAFHLWGGGTQGGNPYLGYLAWADGLIVTGESESMLAEAASTGKPLYIAPLPSKRLGAKKRLRRAMTIAAHRQHGGRARLCRAVFNNGWMTPSRDLEKMHALMYEAGFARPFASELSLAALTRKDASKPFLDRMAGIVTSCLQPSTQPSTQP